ncbi:MAG TPA: HAD family hydrolase [Mycobacteriales bacterium]|nr:HAD family hydrolase [Mycobacteriales bacterium]
MVRIEAVVFDWGGTLTPIFDVDPVSVWVDAARLLAPDRVPELAAALACAQQDVWDTTLDSLRSGRVVEVVSAGVAACGLPVADDEVVASAVSIYLGEWVPHAAAHSTAAEVLRALRRQGLRTGLLSNTHWPAEWHEQRLAEDGLTDLLDARVYTSDLDYRKPHPEAFAAVLSALAVEPRHAVFVGDRLHDDIYGAAGMGMRSIWIRNESMPGFDVVPDAVVNELAEVVDVIARWSAPPPDPR